MKKKTLILSLVVILVIFGVFFIFWQFNSQNIRKKVLSLLEQNLEFCEILKDNISFNKGEFWLICNGRPFYTIYENSEVKTEINGWSFLKKDSDLWNKLENCDYYDIRNSELIFYCPKDFNSEELTAKVYNFDRELLEMKKIEEKDFLEIITSDINSAYSFLSNCGIKDLHSFKSEDYPAVLGITFNCSDGDYVVYTDLATVPLQPPILMNLDLSYKQRAKISFEKSFGCLADNVTSTNSMVTITSTCHGRKLEVIYQLRKTPFLSYSLECLEDQLETCLKEFGKYFILPSMKEISKIELIKSGQRNYIYKINDKLISIAILKPPVKIDAFWIKTEGIYR